MMYTKGINSDKYEEIREKVLEPMGKLEAGEHLYIRGLSNEERSRMRMLLYNWLFVTGLKRLYKIKVLDPTTLVVIKQGFSSSVEVERRGGALPPYLEELFKQALLFDDGEFFIHKLHSEGKVSESELDLLLKKFREVLK